MIHRPLTQTQLSALRFMAEKPGCKSCGYDLKRNGSGNLATLRQLNARKLAMPTGGGHMAAPESADWVLTADGVALAKAYSHA